MRPIYECSEATLKKKRKRNNNNTNIIDSHQRYQIWFCKRCKLYLDFIFNVLVLIGISRNDWLALGIRESEMCCWGFHTVISRKIGTTEYWRIEIYLYLKLRLWNSHASTIFKKEKIWLQLISREFWNAVILKLWKLTPKNFSWK